MIEYSAGVLRGEKESLDRVLGGDGISREFGARYILEGSIEKYPYPTKAGCPTVAGRRRMRAAPAGIAPVLSWSWVMVAHSTAHLIK